MTVSRVPVPGDTGSSLPAGRAHLTPLTKATNLHHGARPVPVRPVPEGPAAGVQAARGWSRPDPVAPDPARSANRVEG